MKKFHYLGFLTLFIIGSALFISQNGFATFTDVDTNNQFHEAIEYAQEYGIVNGYEDNSFQPNRKINRAEFTKIIINSAFEESDIYGENCFPDVTDQWFAQFVCTAKRENIINGYSDGFFNPNNEISFAESAKIILLGFDIPIEENAEVWYKPFIEDLSLQRTIPATINNINQKITRGEMVEMIWRTVEDIQNLDFAEYTNGEFTSQTAIIDGNFDDQYYYDDEYEDGDIFYIYEEEVESAQDCTEFEEYDPETSVCFFECSSEQECSDINNQIDAIFEELGGEYDDFSNDFKEFEGDSSELEENAEVVYEVQTGEQFVIIQGTETENHKKIKKWIAAISPNKFSDTYLNRVIPYTPTNDDGTLAFVTPSSDSNKWDMYVNMNSFQDGEKEVIFTLIHEFAHILTLNAAQIDSNVGESNCQDYFTQEGCVQNNAYLNRFYEKFWKGKFDAKSQDSDKNYDKKPSAFVTNYAATNPGEDIAESFASFVFNKKHVSPSTIAEQKVNFFYSYPELEKMRDSIRLELQSFVRARIGQ